MKNIITYKRIKTNYDNVCYVNSIFALFLYLYINKGDQNTVFVSHVDFEALLKNSQLDNVIIVDTKLNGNWDSLLYKLGLLKYDVTEFIQGKTFFGHDHITYAFLFDLKNGSILEDGIGNYNGQIPILKRFKRAIKGRVISPLGYDKKIQHVYLSKPEQVDPLLCNKVVPFTIPDFLAYTRSYGLALVFEQFTLELNNKNILFTQPISEAAIVSEIEKVQVYREIIEKYKINMIKPHPRDYTDYSLYFECDIIDKYIPAEAMICPNGENISLFTLNSTSLFNLKEVNSNIDIHILLSDLHKDLYDWKLGNYNF
ncbi:glycosyltransferase family 52 [Vibrio alfacsensis]|uniref:glycosyltransferase family 52 n=1 Tax=Vibrio TaxID=662 RepID=UPI0040679968